MTTAVKNETEQKVIDGVRKQLYIGGEWRDGSEGGTLAGEGASPSQHGVSEGLDIVRVHTPRPMWTGCQSRLWHVHTFGKSARVTG